MSYSLFRSMWAHSVTVALVFYLKWHLIEVLNLLENVLFKTWRRGTCLSCTVIAWKSPFYEAVRSIKHGVFLCLHINEKNSKYSRGLSRSRGGGTAPEVGQGQQ